MHGGDKKLTLSDIKAYPVIAADARRYEDLGRRISAQAEAIFGEEAELTKTQLYEKLDNITRKNNSTNVLSGEIASNRTQERAIKDIIDNFHTITDGGEVIRPANINAFQEKYVGAHNDRMRPVKLDLSEIDGYKSSSDKENGPDTVVVNEGKANEQVFKKHFDGSWYLHAKDKEPVKAKGFKYNTESKTLSYDTN